MKTIVMGVLGVLLVFLGVSTAWAAAGARQRDPPVEAQHAASLESEAPGEGQAFASATALMDAGRSEEARRAFERIASRAPNHAPTLWRLSALAALAGDKPGAIEHAQRAVAASKVWQAKLTLAEAHLLAPRSETDVREARELLRQLDQEHPAPETTMGLIRLALAENDEPGLGMAVSQLERQAPTSPATFVWKTVYLSSKEDFDGARASIERAVELGFPRDAADDLARQSGVAGHERQWRYAKIGGYVFGLWFMGLAFIYLAGRALSHAALAAVDAAAGNGDVLEQKTKRFRSVYGTLIAFSAIYYYVSIPVVMAGVVLFAGGIIMGFIALGRIPIKLVLIVGFMALVSVWAMLKSLFVRRGPETPPGRPLTEAEAPALWKLLREIAQNVKTRPVDEVYLTMGTELAVTELGSLRARLRDQGRRVLILGLGVLPDMTVAQLSAVLAHEYGHFSNRDTARGDLALAVQAGLFRSAVGIAEGGGAAWYNPAWLFVNGFHAMFLRVTHGASRLQEVMADRFAAAAYGARAFSEGLVHAIRRSIAFGRDVNQLVASAEASQQPIPNLYAPSAAAANGPAAVGEPEVPLEEAVRRALEEPGSPFDSHPPPHRRIEWVSRMAASAASAPPQAEATLAWDLLPNRGALEREMTRLANENLAAQGIIATNESPAAEVALNPGATSGAVPLG